MTISASSTSVSQQQPGRIDGRRDQQQPDHQYCFHGDGGVWIGNSSAGNFSSSPGETDMIMRNISTGAFEVYDIANNQITGAAALG